MLKWIIWREVCVAKKPNMDLYCPGEIARPLYRWTLTWTRTFLNEILRCIVFFNSK